MRKKIEHLRASGLSVRTALRSLVAATVLAGSGSALASDAHLSVPVKVEEVTLKASPFPVQMAKMDVKLNEGADVAYAGLTYRAPAGLRFCVVYATYHGGREVYQGRQSEHCLTAAADGLVTDLVLAGTEASGNDILLATIVLRDRRVTTEPVLLPTSLLAAKPR